MVFFDQVPLPAGPQEGPETALCAVSLRRASPRVLSTSYWLLDRVLGLRCLKMTEDGPKMAPRWPQAGLKVAQHGS